jgi:hypothetical protein
MNNNISISSHSDRCDFKAVGFMGAPAGLGCMGLVFFFFLAGAG